MRSLPVTGSDPSTPACLVVGGGPLGLCVTVAAQARGLEVHVAEPWAARRQAAIQAGATAAHEAEIPHTYPATVVTAGMAPAVPAAVAATAPGGAISVLALGSATLPTTSGPTRLAGSVGYLMDDFHEAVSLINTGTVRLGFAVSQRFSLTDINAAFRYALDDLTAVKVMISD